MNRSHRVLAGARSLLTLAGIGGGLVITGIAQAVLLLIAGATIGEAAIDLGLIGAPGFFVLYGTYRLSRAGIDPEVYPRVTIWAVGGISLMIGVVGLLAINPGGSVDRPLRAVAIAGGLGAIGGLLVGANEARAISRAREAERHVRELERTQAELRETVDRLEESNRRLEQFAYAASHDLQEPLRMVSSYLRLVENRYKDDLDEDAREFIGFAVDGADRMREMIEGLLEYSRVEAKGDPFEPVDLESVFEDARTDLAVKIEENDAEVTADPLPDAEGDRSQLRQVFQNLLTNAIEYGGDEPRVHVSGEHEGDRLVISVSDDGIGIDPDYHDRIFQLFQHLEAVGDHSGTGIGLAVCERIVERHGGEIWVESEPGDGSTFYFTLPSTGGTTGTYPAIGSESSV